MPSRLNPYISFDGDARQAMEFYKEVFGGTLAIHTFGDFGNQVGGAADKIMHSMLETDSGFTLMCADTPPGMEYKPGNNISVSLSGDDSRRTARLLGRALRRGHGLGAAGKADVGRRLRHVYGPLRHHLAGQYQRAGLNGWPTDPHVLNHSTLPEPLSATLLPTGGSGSGSVRALLLWPDHREITRTGGPASHSGSSVVVSERGVTDWADVA